MLQGSFGVSNEGSIVSEEEFTDQLLKSFCVGMQSPEVKQTAVKTVTDVDSTVIVKVFCDQFKNHVEKMLNRVGARTQPCFTPLTMGNEV